MLKRSGAPEHSPCCVERRRRAKKEIKQKLKTLSTPGRLFWRGGGDNYCYGGRDAAVRVSCRGGGKVTFREEREHGRLPRTRPGGEGGRERGRDGRRWRRDPVTPGACGEPRPHRAQLIDTSPAGALQRRRAGGTQTLPSTPHSQTNCDPTAARRSRINRLEGKTAARGGVKVPTPVPSGLLASALLFPLSMQTPPSSATEGPYLSVPQSRWTAPPRTTASASAPCAGCAPSSAASRPRSAPASTGRQQQLRFHCL